LMNFVTPGLLLRDTWQWSHVRSTNSSDFRDGLILSSPNQQPTTAL
jgi:hypothetical protein